MSLTVPVSLLEKAQHGAVSDDEFVDCIRESLPYAWSMIERLAKELDATGAPSAQNLEVPPDDASWGEVFRLVGSDAMRGAVQRHFGVRMAFQNCCKVGLFRLDATEEYQAFISLRAQLLNQDPSLLNC
ncbi:MAG TPA: SCO5389 family protein [Pseudonocardiaceae bacterium]|nr:SCO5389 family protein [Pseudonocardiaceae bacterium]